MSTSCSPSPRAGCERASATEAAALQRTRSALQRTRSALLTASSLAQDAYIRSVQTAIQKLRALAQQAAAAAPAAPGAADASAQSATSRPAGSLASASVSAAAPPQHAAQHAPADPRAAAAAAPRPDEYWRLVYELRDKYTAPLNATRATVSRMSTATGDNKVLRSIDEQLLPLLCSTPASPAPAFPTVADLLAAERSIVTLVSRVQTLLANARQHQQGRVQQAAAQQRTAAAPPPPPPAKRRADAALLELPPSAQRRQARAAPLLGCSGTVV